MAKNGGESRQRQARKGVAEGGGNDRAPWEHHDQDIPRFKGFPETGSNSLTGSTEEATATQPRLVRMSRHEARRDGWQAGTTWS